jgi:hypothetical protein
MIVTEMAAIPDRLGIMMQDLSPVVEFALPDDYNFIRVTNQTGHSSYFESEAIHFAKSLKDAIIYLSNISEPGIRWHGGYIFVMIPGIPKTWYIIAPIIFETVAGYEENLQNKISEEVVPVEI